MAEFFRDGVKAFETTPARVSKVSGTKTPIELSVPLKSLAPGRHMVQLSVVDEIGNRFAFMRSAIVILERRSGSPAAD